MNNVALRANRRFAARLLDIKHPLKLPVYAALPLLAVWLAAVAWANFLRTCPEIAAAGRLATLMALLLAVAVLLPCMLAYLITDLFADPRETLTRWLQYCPEAKAQITDLVEKDACDETAAGTIVGHFSQIPVLARVFIGRITLLPLLFGYVATIFSVAMSGIAYWDYVGGHYVSAFGNLMYASPGIVGAFRLCEHSAYLNLVTLSTLGYGDAVPRILIARLIVDLEIVTTLFVLTFVANVIGGLVMENSSWAWQGRQELAVVFVKDIITARLNIRPAALRDPT